MYIYIYIYIHTYTCIYTYIHVSHLYTYLYIDPKGGGSEQLPNHRHRNLKTFQEHVHTQVCYLSLQRIGYGTYLG